MLNIIQKPYNFSKNLWSLPFKRASDNVETNAKQTLTKKWKLVCPNESGPIFALELASLMELNYGQESQT